MRIADTLLTDNDRRKLDLFVFLREMPTSAREYALERRIPYSTALRLYKELRTDVKSLCPDATKRELDELTPLTINDYRRFLYSSSVTGQLIDQGFTHDVPSMADFAKAQHISVITLKRRIAPYISELERHNIWFDGGKLTLSVSEPVTESIQYSFFKTTEISIPQKMTPAELTVLEQIASFYEKSDLLQQDHAVQATGGLSSVSGLCGCATCPTCSTIRTKSAVNTRWCTRTRNWTQFRKPSSQPDCGAAPSASCTTQSSS